MRKDRIINIRFLFCVFIGLIIGIIISRIFLLYKYGWLIALATLIIMSGVVVAGYLYGKRTRRYNIQYKSRRKLSGTIIISSIGFGCAILVGMFISIMPIANILMIKEYDRELTITGIVCDYVDYEETYKKFILRDCSIIENGVREEFDYKIMIYTNPQTGVELGDRITFIGELQKYKVSEGYGMNSLINDIGYSSYVNSSNMLISTGDISAKDYIHNRVYDVLQRYLNSDNAEISYAILFGQKEGLDDGISEMFSYSGISHLLAVSGLHVSVLVGIIWFFLKSWRRCNKFIKLGLFGVLLIGYAYLCSFSPSVSRACLMAFILAMCKVLKWEYDSLSSLSFAGIVILLINPLMLFSVSFQLSFMCIYSIIAFAPSINYVLSKVKCPKKLANALAISIAVNVAILPIAINSFGQVSLLGIFANIFVLPLFTCVYIPLFVIALFSAIIKPLGILLYIPNLFLHLIKVIAEYICAIPFGVFRVFNISYWLIVLLILVTLIIHFLMTRHILKTVSVVIMILAIGIMFICNTIPHRYEGDNLIISSQYNSNVAIYVRDGQVSMIGSDVSYKNMLFIMKDLRLNKIDKIYAYDIQLNKINELSRICEEFEVETVYLPDRFEDVNIGSSFYNTEIIRQGSFANNVVFSVIENDNDDIIGIKLNIGNKIVFIPNINNKTADNKYLKQLHQHWDYVIVDNIEDWKESQGYIGIIHEWNDKKIVIKG